MKFNKNYGINWVQFAGVLAVCWIMQAEKVRCSEGSRQGRSQPAPITKIPYLSQVRHPFTSAQKLVQSPTAELVQVTGVKANPTDKGVDIILQTSLGTQLQVLNRSTGNNFIVDIPNAQLSLPSGEAFTFRSEKPLAGITQITVTNIDANTIRVTVTGEAGVPVVELSDSPTEGLIFEVASDASATQVQQSPTQPEIETQPEQPSAESDEPIELVVTGEQDGYRVPNASTATKTDTPLRDIPQSIQVIPRQLIEDQQVNTLRDALRNVTGLSQGTPSSSTRSIFTIRGFNNQEGTGNFLRNGLKDTFASSGLDLSNVERIEVLKGPASVLFGSGTPGATINIITKQPLRDPFYAIEGTVGNYNFYRSAVDLSGPLNDSKTVLYRLNASYKDQGTITDLAEVQNLSIAPVLSLAISEKTNLTFEGDYVYFNSQNAIPFGIPAVGTVLPNPNGKVPLSLRVNEGNFPTRIFRVGYVLEHQFNNSWSLRNAFRFGNSFSESINGNRNSRLLPDNRTLQRTSDSGVNEVNSYIFTTDLIGKFSTGELEHQLVFGFDLGRNSTSNQTTQRAAAPLDLFNPIYGLPLGAVTSQFDTNQKTDALGIYVQDQIKFANNLKLLLSLRFDTFEQTNKNFIANTDTSQSGSAFSPRVGIVYQPIQPISLYASYSRSFNPVIGNAADNSQFQPENGTQYEFGIKAELSNRFAATLAFYDLTRSNVLTTDLPPNTRFFIQTGRQKSQGIELTLEGEILPGWNVIAGYAYTNARVEADNTFRVGNLLNNVPQNNLNLWTTYEFQKGDIKGLGLGLGLFYVSEKQGDLANTFVLPSSLRTDAAIFYKQDRFRAALNFKNLFNIDYFETAFSQLGVTPAEGFTVQGTISWQF